MVTTVKKALLSTIGVLVLVLLITTLLKKPVVEDPPAINLTNNLGISEEDIQTIYAKENLVSKITDVVTHLYSITSKSDLLDNSDYYLTHMTESAYNTLVASFTHYTDTDFSSIEPFIVEEVYYSTDTNTYLVVGTTTRGLTKYVLNIQVSVARGLITNYDGYIMQAYQYKY